MSEATATERLEQLEEVARKADEEVGEIHGRREERGSRIAWCRTELLRLATELPKEFHPDGQPRKGSDAATVKADLDAARATEDGAFLHGAEERARRARRAVTDFMRENHVKLAEELRPEAEALVAEYRSHLQGIAVTVDNWFSLSRRASDLLGPVQGLGGNDIPLGDHLTSVRRTALRELKEPVPLPLSRTLVPQPDFPSRKVMGPKGDGYISIANAEGQTGTVEKRSATPVFKRYGNTNRATRPPTFL